MKMFNLLFNIIGCWGCGTELAYTLHRVRL